MPSQITFLGTGTSTGVPVLTCECEVCRSADERDKRLRTSAFLSNGELKLIIDCGPDFRQQLLTNRIIDFDAILITHGHRDHIAGLDEIRAFNYIRGKTIDVFAQAETVKSIQTEFPYIFNPGKYSGAPKINLNVIDDKPFMLKGRAIIPIPVMHGDDSIMGFRLENLVYVTDASYINKTSVELMKNAEVLVLNALRKKKHSTHFSLDEAVALARMLKARKTYLTHISHFLGCYSDVEKQLPENILLAYDGLTVNC